MKNKTKQQQKYTLKPPSNSSCSVPLEQLVHNPAVQFSPDEKVRCGTL